MAVAVPQSEVSAIPAVKGKFGQRPRGKLVRGNELRNGRRACAGFDDAPHRFIGRQFHDDVERSRIDASAAQGILEDLARARTFLAEHPACREQMAALESLERSEFVRFGDHQDELINGPRDLSQERLINVALDKAQIGGAIEHGAKTCSELPMCSSTVTPGWAEWNR